MGYTRQVRWYMPAQDPPVAKRELYGLPKHGQGALLEVIARFQKGQERPGEVYPIRGSIFELRASVGGDIFRALYFRDTTVHFILLHVFQKKTQKTPGRHIRTAEQRMKHWKGNNTNKPD